MFDEHTTSLACKAWIGVVRWMACLLGYATSLAAIAVCADNHAMGYQGVGSGAILTCCRKYQRVVLACHRQCQGVSRDTFFEILTRVLTDVLDVVLLVM